MTVLAPASLNLTPAGYYMLFLVNAAGVMSVASFPQVAGLEEPTSPTVTKGGIDNGR